MKKVFLSFFFFYTTLGWAGSIEFYYNVPPHDNPQGRGLRPNLIREIDSAKKTLEGSFYQISDPKIVDAFIRAQKRGVSVVLTTDGEWYDPEEHNVTEYVAAREKLEAAGVTVLPDSAGGLNHNKYLIMDRETSQARVWMGSTNTTHQCTFENGNISFLFRSKDVANLFYQDFSQMAEGKFQSKKEGIFDVGGTFTLIGDKPGTKSGLESRDFEGITDPISYPKVTVGDTEVEFYFSPRHNIQKKVIEALYSAQESIHFATYTLDNAMVYQTIMNKALTRGSTFEPYNIYPVALRSDPWENITDGKLRVAQSEGATFDTQSISPTQWDELYQLFGGREEEGKFYNAASTFYPVGKMGGKITKVPVYGILNRLGSSKGPYQTFLHMGIPVRLSALRGALHHKFMIIDRRILILGSYNFSSSAEKDNDESAIIIRDPQLVNDVYEEVFVAMFKNAYPEYVPEDAEIWEFSHEQKSIAISEILFDSKKGTAGRYVELYNTATCATPKECEQKAVDLTGWKFWNGNIPWHENKNLSGNTEELISYYNDPLENKFGLNDPEKAHFLRPDLQILWPGEYGLIVGRDFELEYLDEFLAQNEEQFQKIYGRKPQEFFEKYPKLFVSSDLLDHDVGAGLLPYNFVTLFYPDKFMIADRFDVNAAFGQGVLDGTHFIDFLMEGNRFKLNLKRDQSLERVYIDEGKRNSSHKTYVQPYGQEYALYWYGAPAYSVPGEWQPNQNEFHTPGFAYKSK